MGALASWQHPRLLSPQGNPDSPKEPAMRKPPPRPNPVTVYLAELSEGSRRTMRFALTTAARFFGGGEPERFRWERLRVEHLTGLRADLAERLAPNTANKILAAVRGVL